MVKLSKYRPAYCTKDGTGYFALYEKDPETKQIFEVCRVYHNTGEFITALHARAVMIQTLLNNGRSSAS